MLPRLLFAMVLALLPLSSPARLNDTQLLSIAAGVLILIVCWETVTGLERDAELFESWSDSLDLSPGESADAVEKGDNPSAMDKGWDG